VIDPSRDRRDADLVDGHGERSITGDPATLPAVRWASSISDADELSAALEQASDELERQLSSSSCDLVLVFVTPQHRSRWHEIPATLRDRFPGALVLGCSAAGVIGDGRELEQSAGLSLAGACLPGVELTPFHLPAERTPDPAEPDDDPEAERARWNHALGLADGPDPHLLLFADPFTWSGPELIEGLDRAYPGGVKVGGLASGGARPGEHRLFCERSAHHRGMVGVALRGALELDAVVSQGCTPIGAPMFVTRHQQQVIFDLDGRPAVEVLQQLFESLDDRDRARARHSLLLGVVMDRHREIYDRGDFVIRDLVGVDPQSGALATGTPLYKNAVVQFHLRDAATSAADLHELMAAKTRRPAPAAALLFSCVGRGRGLYGRANHDSEVIREQLGDALPIVGFFGNGEIGPVGGRTHLHGYTSAILLVR
jgi:small ligand-binding sensory domain FIST